MTEIKTKQSSRILTFDLMRGYFMVSIVLNHLYWYPNGLDWVAARGNLFVTAAEGFFLISGIVLGTVRGRKLIDKPFRHAATLLLNRGVQLYVTSIVLMLLFTLIGWWFFMDNPGLKPGIRPSNEPFWQVVVGALRFDYLYGWADFLRLYSIFILISPLALWLLRKGKWYIVMAISIFVWTLYPAVGTSTKTAELLMPIAWQLIFFSGFVIGFHWNQLANWWQSLSITLRRNVTAFIVATAVVTVLANIIIAFDLTLFGLTTQATTAIETVLSPFFTKESLPVPRLLLAAVWFWAAFWLFSRLERYIVKFFGWILMPFGMNSLYVYTIHAFVVFFAHLVMIGTDHGIVINTIGTSIAIGLIWLAVRYKFLMKIIPR
ncbi:OpgC domain-containing protein [Candidatus Saccharibacteria bacterium]|nr:OpgC domain-containing protein [Candidatus Saccharibacteria bacterium]